MDRCRYCERVSACPVCARSVAGLSHVGVRGTVNKARVPVIGASVTVDKQASGMWHYAQPCGHRVYLAAPSTGQTANVTYNGGPLWKDGYSWQLKTDMDPGSGWVIGNEELCDFCDANFVCNRILTGEYVNAWYDRAKAACWMGR